ncbi:MAG TPA: ECF transporter S component [Candidatus Eremiobacteraeota bacterium]|nr:MAG: Thiamine precursor transporter HmpT [bacterium ADurb.Bin363]HPZ06500.1 ECF transporter S component [Candidatus Eremiobacteraeota bacterium]
MNNGPPYHSPSGKIREIVFLGLLTALVVVSTMSIRIPTPTGGYINPGDIIVIFSGFFLGGKRGFIIGGFGSALADLLGGYPAYIPITFITKGTEGFIAGYIGRDLNNRENFLNLLLGAILAGFFMVTGYFAGETIFFGLGVALPPLIPNIFQAFTGIIGALLVYKLIGKDIRRRLIL